MAVLESNDQLGQLWALIQELSEQLNRNRSVSVSLLAQAGNIKNQAIHSQSGFVLRRFNLDKSQEEYDAELERMNTSMVAENQALQRDNKQLNTLIKDFRNRAKEVQEQELSLIREYETKLLARQDEYVAQDLASAVTFSQSLARLSHLLRHFLRSLNGEDLASPVTSEDGEDNREPWAASAASQHALERETELSRLETENEELRRMLGSYAVPSNIRSTIEVRSTFELQRRNDEGTNMQNLESTSATNGPYGTYKRLLSQV
ncbi:hypothetical protein C0993_000421 [Termitomyces sp. T159_Od127]|nr:hypothetical protein C0993_000421 [Termitomyces sp. T159_Od127]